MPPSVTPFHRMDDDEVIVGAGVAIASPTASVALLPSSLTDTIVVSESGASPSASYTSDTTVFLAPSELRLDQEPLLSCRKRKSHATMSSSWWSFLPSLLQLWKLSLPLIMQLFLECAGPAISLLAVGQWAPGKDDINLAAANVAIMYSNVTGLSVGLGLATALDTLCSQAWGLPESRPKMALFVQRGYVVCLVGMIPIALLNCIIPYALEAFQQPQDISVLASRYAHLILPGLPLVLHYNIWAKALQARGLIWPLLVSGVSANLAVAAFAYVLLHVYHFSFEDAALAASLGNVVFPLSLGIYIFSSGNGWMVWRPWSSVEVFDLENIAAFVKLSINGMLLMCAEWWSFELLGLIVGYMPNPDLMLSVHAVIYTIMSQKYMLYMAVSIATAVLIGNALGAQDGASARSLATVSLVSSTVVSLLVGSVGWAYDRDVASVVTCSAQVLDMVHQVGAPAFASEVCFAVYIVGAGVLRGCGKQQAGALWIGIGYAFVGLPSAYVFGVQRGCGLEAIWWANAVALIVGSVGILCTIVRIDWQNEADFAVARLRGNSCASLELSEDG